MTRRHVRSVASITTDWRGRVDGAGKLVRLETNHTIRGVPSPDWPVLVVGQTHTESADYEGYRRTRKRIGGQSGAPVDAGIEWVR